MVARNRPTHNQQERMNSRKNTDKSTSKCTHCHKKGHTKDRCFELVGYPDWWEHNRDPRKKNSKSTSLATAAKTKPIEDPTETTSAQIATTSDVGKVLNTSTPVFNSTWIIDSGATDHMTFDSKQVSPLKPSIQKFVSTANGTSTSVIGE